MTPLRQRMIEDLQLRGLSDKCRGLYNPLLLFSIRPGANCSGKTMKLENKSDGNNKRHQGVCNFAGVWGYR